MGRPREHNEATRVALSAAAEQLVAAGGPDALSVRTVAAEAGTTTRAVYSLFGSKEGLIADLARRAFDILVEGLQELPVTDDPAGDLVEVGASVFRGLVIEHPSLFRIAFQRVVPGLRADDRLTQSRERALAGLEARIARLEKGGLLGEKTVREAAIEFHALCEGLGNVQLRGSVLTMLPEGAEEQAWRRALATLVTGFAATGSKDWTRAGAK